MALSEFTIEVSLRIIDGWIDEGIEYCLVEFKVSNYPSEIRLYSIEI